jgi:hypothetical protein
MIEEEVKEVKAEHKVIPRRKLINKVRRKVKR